MADQNEIHGNQTEASAPKKAGKLPEWASFTAALTGIYRQRHHTFCQVRLSPLSYSRPQKK